MQSLKHNISSANDNVTTCQSVVETKRLEYKTIKERLQEMMKEERQGKAQLEAAIQSWEQAKNQRKVAEEEMSRYIQSSSDPSTPPTPRRSGLRPRNTNAATQMSIVFD